MSEVRDYRFALSDGTNVWVIIRGSSDDRIYDRLHETINRMEEREQKLRARRLDTKPGKLKAV